MEFTTTLTWTVPIEGMSSTDVAALDGAVTDLIRRFDPACPAVNSQRASKLSVRGWDRPLAVEFLSRLRRDGGTIQADTIAVAAAAGGRIDRAKVYELAGWDPGKRSLKGFTRPVNRILHQMHEQGILPSGAPRPLEPLYIKTRHGGQPAGSFEVPAELAPLFRAI